MRDDETLAELLDKLRSAERGHPAHLRREPTSTHAVPVPPMCPGFRGTSASGCAGSLLHLIEELARHAGHADIIREALDGATMYELMAGNLGSLTERRLVSSRGRRQRGVEM